MSNVSIESLEQLVAAKIPDGLKLLKEIVEINSYSTSIEGNNKVQDVLQREFLNLGLNVDRISCVMAGDILVARTKVSKDKDIALIGHSDTVFPPNSTFQKMESDGERVIGPGVCDMKGGLVTIFLGLWVLKELGELDNYPLRIIINTDEETGSVYSRKTFLENIPFIKKALVFETGKVNDLVVTSRVGSRSFILKSHGKAAHAGSAFKEGANAISRICYIANELRKLTDFSKDLTCNIGIIRGGEAVNTVPPYAELRFELRASLLSVLEEATEKAREIINREEIFNTTAELEIVYTSLPFERTLEVENLFKSYQKAGKLIGLNYQTNEQPIRGGSDANYIAAHQIPTIDALGPFGEGHHSHNEFMVISSLKPKTLNWLVWLLSEQ